MYSNAVRALVLVLVALAACSSSKHSDAPPTPSNSAATLPSEPPRDLAALRADVDIMCNAAKMTGGKVFMDVGPYMAEHMHTAYKAPLFKDVRHATLDELIARMRELTAKVNVTSCDTIDVLVANDPRKQPTD